MSWSCWHGRARRFPYAAVQLDYPREELYARIGRRVDHMLEGGLVDEVRALLAAGVPENAQSMQGIGYKEVLDFLKNRCSHSTMSDMIKQNTRHYAKRQITFFKKFPKMLRLDARESGVADTITELFYHDDHGTDPTM